jgi:hypothetical protein
MTCGDMPRLMAQDEGELRLVVHEREELASDVDVTAGHGEGVLDCRIEQGEMIGCARVGDARKGRDLVPDLIDVGGPGTDLGPAVLLDDLDILFLSFGN